MIDELLKNASNRETLTRFLSIEEQAELKRKSNSVFFSYENHERKRAFIFKGDIQKDFNFEIRVLKIEYNKKFAEIKHRDILGALMGLGIKRECVGDIIIADNIYVFVIDEMTEYIKNNLSTIGKTAVDIKIIDIKEIEDLIGNNYIETELNVSSFRLDVIISEYLGFSRERSKEYINLKNVKVNGIIKLSIDYIVKYDDLLSLHKYGRLIIKDIVRQTKKNKYIVRVLKTV